MATNHRPSKSFDNRQYLSYNSSGVAESMMFQPPEKQTERTKLEIPEGYEVVVTEESLADYRLK